MCVVFRPEGSQDLALISVMVILETVNLLSIYGTAAVHGQIQNSQDISTLNKIIVSAVITGIVFTTILMLELLGWSYPRILQS